MPGIAVPMTEPSLGNSVIWDPIPLRSRSATVSSGKQEVAEIILGKDILEEIGLTHMIVENIEESDEPADCNDHGNHPDREQ